MKSKYKKEIFTYFSSGLETLEHELEYKNNPFYPYSLWLALKKSDAIYRGEADEICRSSYVYFMPEDNVYLTCIVWLECEFTYQIVYLEGDTEENVEYAEMKLKRNLFNNTTLTSSNTWRE